MLEMYVRPSIKYVCFCFFCVLLAFSLFLLFNANVFCFRHFCNEGQMEHHMGASYILCHLFYYVNKHT